MGADAVALQLDVTDQASITAAAKRVRDEFGRLDVLIQNAGISTTSDVESPEQYSKANRPSVVSLDEMRAVWDTNVFGVLSIYQAMVPILRNTPNSRIVNVSSGAGSLTLNSDPNSPLRPSFNTTYPASKTALNALTLAMAIELEADGIPVNAVSRAIQRQRSTASLARIRWRRVLQRPCASRCWGPRGQLVCSRTRRWVRFRGDLKKNLRRPTACPTCKRIAQSCLK